MSLSADWVMVIITGIYVVATILIFITNRNATIAAQEQVAEMKKEFEDNNRPIIEVELDLKQRQMYTLHKMAKENQNIKFEAYKVEKIEGTLVKYDPSINLLDNEKVANTDNDFSK